MATVTLVQPASGPTTIHGGGGAAILPNDDGTVTVDASRVPALLAAGFQHLPTVAAQSVALTTGTKTISTYAPIVKLTGTLSGNVTLVFPNLPGRWDLDAGALVMGGNSVTCQSGSASAAALTSSDIGTTQTKTQLVTVITEGGNTITISR